MNQKYSAILFTLLVFFLIHVEKAHGCNPAGTKSCSPLTYITNVQWLTTSKFNMTLTAPSKHFPEALSNMTIQWYDGKLHNETVFDEPVFINGHHCDSKGSNEVNPITTTWNSPIQFPKGSVVTTFVTIYWDCDQKKGKFVKCCHSDVLYISTV
ncbi:893_t:CDS:2 [Diversispora eburnea]|uniref:893_t:CDS:1 n=1 Tax=Diversispora eburnea TaxID=1213867 RepID=A0A9N9BGV1_9GLOM|nr:893_t:CDS:2 [Diversispora eburnea]